MLPAARFYFAKSVREDPAGYNMKGIFTLLQIKSDQDENVYLVENTPGNNRDNNNDLWNKNNYCRSFRKISIKRYRQK